MATNTTATSRARAEAIRIRSSAATASGRDGRSDEGGRRGVRADDEPARGSEDRVGQQRHERRVQAGLGRQAGDLGVPDAQRHDQGRDRQPADAVLAELLASIAAQGPAPAVAPTGSARRTGAIRARRLEPRRTAGQAWPAGLGSVRPGSRGRCADRRRRLRYRCRRRRRRRRGPRAQLDAEVGQPAADLPVDGLGADDRLVDRPGGRMHDHRLGLRARPARRASRSAPRTPPPRRSPHPAG